MNGSLVIMVMVVRVTAWLTDCDQLLGSDDGDGEESKGRRLEKGVPKAEQGRERPTFWCRPNAAEEGRLKT
jgi:hypothetical protein